MCNDAPYYPHSSKHAVDVPMRETALRILPDHKRGDLSFFTWMLFIRRVPMIPRARQNRQFQVSGKQESQFPHSDPTKIAISIDFLEQIPSLGTPWHLPAQRQTEPT